MINAFLHSSCYLQKRCIITKVCFQIWMIHKRAAINWNYCMALGFLCACWADCTQAAILHLSCRQFIGTWELCGEGSTNTVCLVFFPTSCPRPTLLWAAKQEIHSRATVLLLCLRCLGGYMAYVCGDLTLRQTAFTLTYRKSSSM